MTTLNPSPFRIMSKSQSLLMRALAVILWPLNRRFMEAYWTTIGRTIYAPARYDADPDWGTQAFIDRHATILLHESVHVRQFEVIGPVAMSLMYLGGAPAATLLALVGWAALGVDALIGFGLVALCLVPSSLGFAYGRWVLERQAYMTNITAASDRQAAAERAVHMLWHEYGFTWPKPWMRKWFGTQIAALPPR